MVLSVTYREIRQNVSNSVYLRHTYHNVYFSVWMWQKAVLSENYALQYTSVYEEDVNCKLRKHVYKFRS